MSSHNANGEANEGEQNGRTFGQDGSFKMKQRASALAKEKDARDGRKKSGFGSGLIGGSFMKKSGKGIHLTAPTGVLSCKSQYLH